MEMKTIKTGNIFSDIPDNLPDELFEVMLDAENLKVERIVSKGHSTEKGKWFDQDRDEWVLLLRGSARILFDNSEKSVIDLKPGDYLQIPMHHRHRVEWTNPDTETIWLACKFHQ